MILFSLFCLSIISYSQEDELDIVGKIRVLRADNFLDLKAEAINNSILFVDELSYNLVALKKGVSGNYSNNKQAGEFSIKPNEKKELTLLRLSINKGEELKAYLFIKHRDKLISRDTFALGIREKNKRKVAKINESSFMLKGLVIDEATTKIGKDFYDFFYQSYLLSGVKYPFIIKIKERPGLRRTTNISVEVEDNKIFEFRSNPREEYLKEVVNISMARLRVYEKRRKFIANQKI